MKTDIWEDFISLNSRGEPQLEALEPAAKHRESDAHPTNWVKEIKELEVPLERDTYPLPTTKAREGYYGRHHFSYWASGLRDMNNLLACAQRNNVDVRSYYDFGCASGRIIRHFAINRPDINVIGSDINRFHVEWIMRYLPETITVFQNHSVPSLPLPDAEIDLLSAFSVFTHIEAFETSWLMELRRVLRPGGLAWITVHSEKTWEEIAPGWPLYNALRNHPEFDKTEPRPAMTQDRKVFRWRTDKSYSSNVFYTFDYIHRSWGRMFDIVEVYRRLPGFQDVVVLRKPA